MKEYLKDKLDSQIIFLQFFFPISIIIGNFAINFSIIVIAFLTLIKVFFDRNILVDNKKTFYLLLFLFFSFIVNLFFSHSIELSLRRVFKFFFVIFFVISFIYTSKKYEKILDNFYKFWFIIFIIIIFDLFIELLTGTNIFGQTSGMYPGRLGSFTGNESTIGYYFLGFCLFFLSFSFHKYQNQKLVISLYVLVIVSSFLIGERSNFIKLFISIILFLSLTTSINFKTKIFIIFVTMTLIVSTLYLNESYKLRYYDQVKSIFSKNGYSKFMKSSLYGVQQDAAYKMFEENFYFGVGLKNYRNEVRKKKYENTEYIDTKKRFTTHPHQVHYEFLSETGITGYFTFIIFIFSSLFLAIKSYLKTNNLYQLSGIIFVLTSILPIIPSGSFFSTYSSSIFWINFAIMCGYLRKN